jgi:hypothetical protein
MFSSVTGRAKANESKYPHIVELAIESDQLDVKLSRRIIESHANRFQCKGIFGAIQSADLTRLLTTIAVSGACG